MTAKNPVRKLWWAALSIPLACGAGDPANLSEVTSLPDLPVEIRPQASGQRRALLIGIDQYTTLQPSNVRRATGGRRRWSNLQGAVNDVESLREALVAFYAFEPREIVTLNDQAATRRAILQAIEKHLLEGTNKGDLALFYFSGHGSQVRNLLSDETDRLDESLVPADSNRGAPDLRDKELRRLFNRILDRGVRLTVILDSCHSGSGIRGLPDGGQPKGLEPDLRDAADGSSSGPAPEARGALVMSAAQDFELAWETRDESGRPRGAFSLALLRALRDAGPGEAAEDLFLRARARLQSDKRYQEPVLAGNEAVRRAPFLGDQSGQRRTRSMIAVERVQGQGTVILQGGWVNGLAVGSELRLAGQPDLLLEVTALHGLSRCEARIVSRKRSSSVSVSTGDLVEVVSWTAPPDAPLRVWLPRTTGLDSLVALAQEIARAAVSRGIAWIADPTETTPTHVLRWTGREWELLGTNGAAELLGATVEAESLLARVTGPSPSLFVQLPASAALAQAIEIGPGTDHTGVDPTGAPDEADYLLVGRLSGDRVEYAWVRPGAGPTDRPGSPLPARTAWHPLDRGSAARATTAGLTLQDSILRLRKIQAWYRLEAPPGAPSPYRLVLRRSRDGQWAEKGALAGGEAYGLFLRAQQTGQALASPRWVYVFVIDSHGRSILLFPSQGPVENRVSPPSNRSGSPAPASEILLGSAAAFKVSEPYGADTYFLLTSDEPIPNPWVLSWDGVRARGPRGTTPLEELLSVTGGSSRSSTPLRTPPTWSLEKTVYESVPPGTPLP